MVKLIQVIQLPVSYSSLYSLLLIFALAMGLVCLIVAFTDIKLLKISLKDGRGSFLLTTSLTKNPYRSGLLGLVAVAHILLHLVDFPHLLL